MQASSCVGLDNDGFAEFAEDSAEGVGYFAYGGVGFDGGEDVGHEVGVGAGGLIDSLQAGLVGDGIACGAEGAETFYLAAFELGIDGLEGGLRPPPSLPVKRLTPTTMASPDSTLRW